MLLAPFLHQSGSAAAAGAVAAAAVLLRVKQRAPFFARLPASSSRGGAVSGTAAVVCPFCLNSRPGPLARQYYVFTSTFLPLQVAGLEGQVEAALQRFSRVAAGRF